MVTAVWSRVGNGPSIFVTGRLPLEYSGTIHRSTQRQVVHGHDVYKGALARMGTSGCSHLLLVLKSVQRGHFRMNEFTDVSIPGQWKCPSATKTPSSLALDVLTGCGKPVKGPESDPQVPPPGTQFRPALGLGWTDRPPHLSDRASPTAEELSHYPCLGPAFCHLRP